MLLSQMKKIKKWIGGDGYAYGKSCDDGFTGVYLPQTHQVVYADV